jgi:hypothetical protein
MCFMGYLGGEWRVDAPVAFFLDKNGLEIVILQIP